MAVYILRSGSTTLVSVKASSNLDGPARPLTRRGEVFPTLGGGVAIQYLETAALGDIPIEWDVHRADGSQRGILQSACTGTYGDELVLVSPRYGNISVAVMPGEEGYTEEWLSPNFGYRIRIRFVRL